MSLTVTAKGADGRLSGATSVALHAAVATVFLVFAALRWAHAERRWTFAVGHIERNGELAADILAVFVTLAAAVFAFHRPSPRQYVQRRPRLHAALSALYVACVVVLVVTAPRVLTVGSGLRARLVPDPPFAPRPFTIADREILRHDRYGVAIGRVPVFNFYSTSQIRELAYFGKSQVALTATPGLVGNIVHDVGALKAPEDTPTGFFNASATQFSVSCAAPSNVSASSTDVPLAADPSHDPYSTIRVSLDVPGRGAVNLEDIAYSSREPFGFVFSKGAHAPYPRGFTRGSQYIRFPRVFNATTPATFPDNTIYSVAYDRTADNSGVDDDLSNTIFFYLFQLLIKDDPPDTESAVVVIRDRQGQNGSRVDVSTAAGSTLAEYAALFKVQAVACTMVATTFNTTVAHADNSADLSPAPVSPAARLAHNSSWSAFQPRPASPNSFERDWANIFTPRSAPQASARFDNYSAIPGFEPLNTLESYMSSVIWDSPQLATLESALENITALAYWGLMQEFGDVDYATGSARGLPVGVVQFRDAHLFASLAASIILLLLAVLSRPG